jgi:hypothetical protein
MPVSFTSTPIILLAVIIIYLLIVGQPPSCRVSVPDQSVSHVIKREAVPKQTPGRSPRRSLRFTRDDNSGSVIDSLRRTPIAVIARDPKSLEAISSTPGRAFRNTDDYSS